MNILLTNDDGVYAPGILALARAMRNADHKVYISAPSAQRSGAGQSITPFDPINVERINLDGFEALAVCGTPVDSARLGLLHFPDIRFDWALSGINNGPNLGGAIPYSGTIGAARDISLHYNIPAIAVSVCSENVTDFSPAAETTAKFLEWAAQHRLPRGDIYNLNFPPVGHCRGIRPAVISNDFVHKPTYEKNANGSFILLHGANELPETDDTSDLSRIRAGFASLTVLGWKEISVDFPLDLPEHLTIL